MANKAKKYLKSILPEPKKRDFYRLLDYAVRKDDTSNREIQESRQTSGCNDKQIRQHKTANTSDK